MVQTHEIDFRTPEQLEQETVKEFIDEIEKLKEKYQFDLVMTLKYETKGIFPALSVVKKKPKEEAPKV